MNDDPLLNEDVRYLRRTLKETPYVMTLFMSLAIFDFIIGDIFVGLAMIPILIIHLNTMSVCYKPLKDYYGVFHCNLEMPYIAVKLFDNRITPLLPKKAEKMLLRTSVLLFLIQLLVWIL